LSTGSRVFHLAHKFGVLLIRDSPAAMVKHDLCCMTGVAVSARAQLLDEGSSVLLRSLARQPLVVLVNLAAGREGWAVMASSKTTAGPARQIVPTILAFILSLRRTSEAGL
jgi:hypothetical protein